MTRDDRKAFFDSQTDRIGLDIVRISGSSFPDIHLCRNSESIASRNKIYIPAPMEVVLPEKGEQGTSASLKISGLEIDHINMVQQAKPDETIEVESAFIFADQPDDYIDGPYYFTVESVSFDTSSGSINFSLTSESVLDYYLSVHSYDNKGFPGIWT